MSRPVYREAYRLVLGQLFLPKAEDRVEELRVSAGDRGRVC